MGGYFGVAASVVQLMGYAVYNKHLSKSENTGNGASWAIWTFGSILNLILYKDLTHDWAKEALPFACSIGCILTFVHIWRKNGMGGLEKSDWWILILDCTIVLYWVVTSNSEASLLYQISTIISFIPIIRGLLKGKDRERPLAWGVWTTAYGLMVCAVFLRWEKWQDIVYPAVCFILHFAVAIISCVTPSTYRK